MVANTASGEVEDTLGIVTTDDNEGPLDLSFKRIPQTTMPLAATEMVTQQRLKSILIKVKR